MPYSEVEDTTTYKRLAAARHRVQQELGALLVAIRSRPNFASLQLEPELYASQFGTVGPDSYGRLNSTVLASENRLKAANGLNASYNQYLTLWLLDAFDPNAGPCQLPQSIVQLYERDYLRIERQLEQMPPQFYSLDNDVFLKDLAILSYRLIPVGAEYAALSSGIPRSLLFKQGVSQFVSGIRACLVQGKGFKPYFELHAHTLALEDFNPEGWEDTYLRLAQLLELNISYRGITSTSWFLDPALEKISSRLSYLREVPETNGATILFSRNDEEGESGALAKSASRRKLFKAGQYVPAIYTRIWPRKQLIAWKNRQQQRKSK